MTGLPLLCPYFIAISVPSNLPIDWHSFRRVEVPSGTPRPRRWSAAEKAAIVAESPAPGSQTIEIALRYGCIAINSMAASGVYQRRVLDSS